jgi:hypothetical protein
VIATKELGSAYIVLCKTFEEWRDQKNQLRFDLESIFYHVLRPIKLIQAWLFL